MNIFIIGIGRVGKHLAQVLISEQHDVTIIESDPRIAGKEEDEIDARIVTGSGTSIDLLRELGVEEADLLVAATGNDEVNLLSAMLGRSLGAAKTIARVGQYDYYQQALEMTSTFRVDHILSPQELTAREATLYMKHPGFTVMDNFAEGLVYAFSFPMDEGAWLNVPISQIDIPEHTLVGMIRRPEGTIIPRGTDVIRPNDVVTFIGKSHKVQLIEQKLKKPHSKVRTVTIAGASSVGIFIARKLEKYRYRIRLVEHNLERCEQIANQFDKVELIHADATSIEALKQSCIDSSSVFIAATEQDDRNILSALMAKEMDIPHCIAVVRQPDFALLVQKLGLDHALIPRAIFADHVREMVQEPGVVSRKILETDQAEILEFRVSETAKIVGRTLADINFPTGALVAAIVRKNKVFVARGSDPIQAQDRVVVIARNPIVPSVMELFLARNHR